MTTLLICRIYFALYWGNSRLTVKFLEFPENHGQFFSSYVNNSLCGTDKQKSYLYLYLTYVVVWQFSDASSYRRGSNGID